MKYIFALTIFVLLTGCGQSQPPPATPAGSPTPQPTSKVESSNTSSTYTVNIQYFYSYYDVALISQYPAVFQAHMRTKKGTCARTAQVTVDSLFQLAEDYPDCNFGKSGMTISIECSNCTSRTFVGSPAVPEFPASSFSFYECDAVSHDSAGGYDCAWDLPYNVK